MVLTLLLPLLASLQMLPRPVSPQDPDPAPQLTLSPQQPVYITGEDVTLTCSATGAPTMSGIRFFRENYKINSTDLLYTNSIQLSGVSRSQAGAYTCEFWKTESGQEITSKRSPPISIAVTDPLPDPQLTVSPQQPVYVTGEAVTLTCSAARASTVSGVRFFRDDQEIQPKELPSPRYRYTNSIQLSGVYGAQSGVYTCQFWKTVSGREITSERSQSISIAVTDLPPQPALSVDPVSRVVSEGIHLLMTSTAPRDAGQRRFHFYKDRAELIPGDVGSEINTTEPRTVSVNTSVLSIPQASSNNTAQSFFWVHELVVGGSFFLINGLIFLVSHCCL